jgi:hypothetical protein
MKNKKLVSKIHRTVCRYFGDEEFTKKELPKAVRTLVEHTQNDKPIRGATAVALAATAQTIGLDLASSKRDGRVVVALLQHAIRAASLATQEAVRSYLDKKIGFQQLQEALAKSSSCCGGCSPDEDDEDDEDDGADYAFASVAATQLEAWKAEVRTPKYIKVNVINNVGSTYHFNVTRYGHAIGLVRVVIRTAGPAFVSACHVGPSQLQAPVPTLQEAMENILKQYDDYRPTK